MTIPATALERLITGFYNANPYSAGANPGGLANGGHQFNFPAALQDVGIVAQQLRDSVGSLQITAARPEFRVNGAYLQYRLQGDVTWIDLHPIANLAASDAQGLRGAQSAWAFARGLYRRDYALLASLAADTRWSFARSGAAYSRDAAGQLVLAASGAPRLTNRGLWLGSARTNLYLNNAALSTQSNAVSAQQYTVSFYGAGSITLSGAHAAVVAGAGSGQRVEYAFTPGAGTLTSTVAGEVANAQLEAGAAASEVIPTTGAAASVAQDSAALTMVPPMTGGLVVEIESLNGAAWGNNGVWYWQGPTASDRFGVYITAGGQVLLQGVIGGTVVSSQLGMVATTAAPVRARIAVGWSPGLIRGSLNGAAPVVLASAMPPGLATLYLGRTTSSLNNPLDGWMSELLLHTTELDVQPASLLGA